MSKTLLVLGVNGQVGFEICAQATNLNFHFLSPLRDELDLTNFEQVHRYIIQNSPDVVINAAAYTAVDLAETEADLAVALNEKLPATLAKTVSEIDSALIHLSTDFVFDGHQDTPYRESAATSPLNIYGASKLAGEHAIAARLDKYIIVRTSWVFSSRQSNFVKTMLRLAREKTKLQIVDDQIGCPTPASDIGKAIMTLVACENPAWGIYHFCGAQPTSWKNFAERIFEIAASHGCQTPHVTPIASRDYAVAAKRPQYSVLDCKKIKDNFGIDQPDWALGLTETVAQILDLTKGQ